MQEKKEKLRKEGPLIIASNPKEEEKKNMRA